MPFGEETCSDLLERLNFRTQTLQNSAAGLSVNVSDVIGVRLKKRADITVDSLELPVSLGDVGLKGDEYQKNEQGRIYGGIEGFEPPFLSLRVTFFPVHNEQFRSKFDGLCGL